MAKYPVFQRNTSVSILSKTVERFCIWAGVVDDNNIFSKNGLTANYIYETLQFNYENQLVK